ncbi:efflux RND transporter periplasmic adaptor subunit [Alcaligenaceae bacterium SJ-26]|nr:efflux RND transporter periplasmic adaptor subunit [Alcaligenaceae bacterium SJ-26]
MKAPMSRRLKVILLLLAGIALLAVGKYVLFPSAPPTPPATASVRTGDIETNVLATGTLEAFKLVSVGAQASGQLQTLHVELGDRVEQGQLVAEIDSLTQQNELRTAETSLLTVRARRQAQAATLREAQLTYNRQKQMLAANASSRQDFDAAEAAQATARAQLAALDAELAQAQIAVDNAQVKLGYTRITAPMAGTVVAIVAQEGQTLNANQSTPTIIKLAQLDQLTVKAQISEADVIRVHPGQRVYFTILGDPDTRHYATLRSVEPAPDSISSESSTSTSSSSSSTSSAVYYNGLFDIPNPDGLLRISMTAQVYIILGEAKDALLIPSSALSNPGTTQGKASVTVLTAGDRLEQREVDVGINNNVDAQITSGLQANDRVVLHVQQPGGLAGATGANRPRGPRMF